MSIVFLPSEILKHDGEGILLGEVTRDDSQLWLVVTEAVNSSENIKEIGCLNKKTVLPEQICKPYLMVNIKNGMTSVTLHNDLLLNRKVKLVIYDKAHLSKADVMYLLHDKDKKTPVHFLLKCNSNSPGDVSNPTCEALPSLLKSSSFFTHLALKLCICYHTLLNIRTTKGLIVWNRLLIFLLDVFLGLALYHFMNENFSIDDAVHSFLDTTDDVVTWLEELLGWLMGAPAGLKLNAPLSHNMGKFFLYHIYLWRNYISLVTPLLRTFMIVCVSMSSLGLSFILCAIRDLFWLATIHIYCFYAYAARLYSLFVSWSRCLWRLFRGRKWNPLRSRVDSYNYDINQLITGTVALSILLFLLPTVTLYYVVFVSLWLAVLGIRACLWIFLQVLNYNPLALLLIKILFPSKVKGEFGVFVCGENKDGCMVAYLSISPASFTRCLLAISGIDLTLDTAPLLNLIKSLLSGRLVFPL